MRRPDVQIAAFIAGVIGFTAGSVLTAWISAGSDVTATAWAAWVQAIGTLFAIAVAIWIPWRIHRSEQDAARRARTGYRDLLLEAFRRLRDPIAYLKALPVRTGEARVEAGWFSDKPGSGWIEKQEAPEETAKQIAAALAHMEDASFVISEIQDMKRLENFDAILAILRFRRAVDSAQPDFARESAWLRERGYSPNVVNNAVATLSAHADELLEGIDRVIAALDRQL